MKLNFDDERLKEKILFGAMTGLKKGAEIVVQDSKVKCPVKTGNLRSSIKVMEDRGVEIKIGSDVYYAFHQHESNPNGKAFFLRNALYEDIDTVANKVFEEIENQLKR